MKSKPCDEIGADLLSAQQQWVFIPDVALTERLIEYVASHYPTKDFEALLERALDLELVDDDTERHGYKCALGSFFNKRAQYAREQMRERDAIEFAPR